MSLPAATIAFVPREQFSTTRRALETLYERTQEPFELICVDGGSPPPIQEYLEQAARTHDFTLLRTESFLTPNQARNIALERVRTRYVVFVDNDVVVGARFLSPLIQCAQETGAWVVGPLYFELEPESDRIHMFGGECRIQILADGSRDFVERHRCAHQRLADVSNDFHFEREETELIEFHTVLVDMEVFRQLGPLDEALLCTAEHADLCLSVRQAGGRVYLEPRSQITYVPPKQLSGADLDYFRLRWSETWNTATRNHLMLKWNLPKDCHGLRQSTIWLRAHRRHALAWLPSLRRHFGRRLSRWLEKYVVAPRESSANRRQYPTSTYSVAKRPEVKVVYEPLASERRVA